MDILTLVGLALAVIAVVRNEFALRRQAKEFSHTAERLNAVLFALEDADMIQLGHKTRRGVVSGPDARSGAIADDAGRLHSYSTSRRTFLATTPNKRTGWKRVFRRS